MSYFDVASTAPLRPEARQALLAALDEGWADPARLYRDARQAQVLLDAARETVAELIGARPDEVSFTASGTQAVHLGVLGALAGRRRAGTWLLTSTVEHSCVLQAGARHLEGGGRVRHVDVDRLGRAKVEDWARLLRDPEAAGLDGGVALACLQSANHEVGTVQPVAEVAELCRAAGVPLLVDAAQSVGRMAVPEGWSLLTASAHKWGGPAGVGVLAVRRGTRYRSPLPSDEREGGRVPGFPNVPSVLAAAAALRGAVEASAAQATRLSGLVDRIRREAPARVPDVSVIGDPVRRLPHLVTLSCLYVDGESLLGELDRAGFAVSSGSSCTSSTVRPSHVLVAMGALSEGNVRVSLPEEVTEAEVDRFLDMLPEAVAAVRSKLALDRGAAGGSAPAAEAPGADPLVVDALVVDALVVDALGTRCPIPIIELARRFPEVPVGSLVAVLSDDAAARLDVPAWCEMRGQEYVGERPATEFVLASAAAPGGSAYLVRRVS